MELDKEEFLHVITLALEAGIPVFPCNASTALTLAQRGFIVVDQRKERPLSVEEIEFICAMERGNVQ